MRRALKKPPMWRWTCRVCGEGGELQKCPPDARYCPVCAREDGVMSVVQVEPLLRGYTTTTATYLRAMRARS